MNGGQWRTFPVIPRRLARGLRGWSWQWWFELLDVELGRAVEEYPSP